MSKHGIARVKRMVNGNLYKGILPALKSRVTGVGETINGFLLRSLKGKIIVFALMAGIIPILIIATLAYFSVSESIRATTGEKLQVSNELTNQWLTAHFKALSDEVSLAAAGSIVYNALTDCEKVLKNNGKINGEEWLEQKEKYYLQLVKIADTYEFDDMLLVSLEGDVVMSTTLSPDLGKNLLYGELKGSSSGKCFSSCLTSVAISDFQPYGPNSGRPSGFIGAPIKDMQGQVQGVCLVRIPYDQINRITQNSTGMGRTGETYVVGQDKLLRSDSRFDVVMTVTSSFALKNTLDNESVNRGLNGEKGVTSLVNSNGFKVISAYSNMKYAGLNWVVVSEIQEEEALASINSFMNLLFIVMLVVMVLVAGFGYLISRLIANPLLSIVPVANAVAVGDVSRSVKVRSRDEVGQVADAFDGVIKYMKEMSIAAQKIAHGDLGVEIHPKSEDDILSKSFLQVVDNLRELSGSVDMLTGAATEGKLDVRGDVSKLDGDYAKIVTGINNMLDAVISPLRLAAEYIDKIAEGQKSEIITAEYRGEFNSIKDNLNICIAAISVLVDETGVVIEAAKDGKLDVRANADRCEGVYRKILNGFNETLDSITLPLSESANVLYRLSEYNLTSKVTGDYKGELGKLKDALNHALDNQLAVVIELKQVSENLADSGNRLNSASDQAGKAAADIASSCRQVAKGAADQATSLQDTMNAMDHLSKAIDQIAKGAQEQASMMEKNIQVIDRVSAAIEEISNNALEATNGAKVAADSAARGFEMSRDTVNGMDRIKKTMDDVSSRINCLGQRSNEIGKIVSAIDEIADQTNLLALNAAVEAARAGEQGRGFAVVADEVRKLAERSSNATKEIADLIYSIQSGVAETVSATNKGIEEVDGGFRLAGLAGEALDDILKRCTEMGKKVEQISGAARQLNEMSNEMVKLGNNISAIVEENTAATQQMAATAREVSKSVEEVAGVAKENSAATDSVSEAAAAITGQVRHIVAAGGELANMADNFKQLVTKYKINGAGKANCIGNDNDIQVAGQVIQEKIAGNINRN